VSRSSASCFDGLSSRFADGGASGTSHQRAASRKIPGHLRSAGGAVWEDDRRFDDPKTGAVAQEVVHLYLKAVAVRLDAVESRASSASRRKHLKPAVRSLTGRSRSVRA
jgi:hypothetical protein